MAARLKAITASPKPSYMIDGQSIQWGAYHRMLTNGIKELSELIERDAGPYEEITEAYTDIHPQGWPVSAFDPSDDFAYFDGTETITYTSVGAQTVSDAGVASSTDTDVSVAGVLRRDVTFDEARDDNSRARMGDTKFHLPNDNMSSTVPKEGDLITDASSDTWRVWQVDKQLLGHRWRCWCRQE
jgi:hypothetical protein